MLVEHRYVTTFFAIHIDYKFSIKCERTYQKWERTSSDLQFPMTGNWWQRIGGWSSKASILGVQNILKGYYIILHIGLQGTVSSFVFCIFILRRLDYKLAIYHHHHYNHHCDKQKSWGILKDVICWKILHRLTEFYSIEIKTQNF